MPDLMPTKKIWNKDEVIIEMITYRTVLVDRLRDAFRKYKDEDGDYSESLIIFMLCAAAITDIQLPSDPPRWAQLLSDLIKSPSWLRNPVKDYESLAFAPSDLMTNWWAAYNDTRDTSHDAPQILQQDPPLPAEAYEGMEGVNDDALNFTENSTMNGGGSSKLKSSNGQSVLLTANPITLVK